MLIWYSTFIRLERIRAVTVIEENISRPTFCAFDQNADVENDLRENCEHF